MPFLKLLESIRAPFWNNFFLAITNLGGETLFIVVILFIIWCADKKTGYYLVFTSALGMGVNRLINALCMVPRPWMLDSSLTVVEGAKEAATGYSFPSGHTQSAVSLYGGLAFFLRKKIFKIFSLAVMLLIAFSRLYLGVHTPYDVVASLIIGLTINTVVYFLFVKSEENRFYKILLAFFAFLSSVIYLIISLSLNGDNAALAVETSKMAYTVFGAMSGILISMYIDEKHLKYETAAPTPVQIFKCFAGTAIILILKTLLKAPLGLLFSGHMAAHAVRYFIIAIFGGTLWPWTFKYWNRIYTK